MLRERVSLNWILVPVVLTLCLSCTGERPETSKPRLPALRDPGHVVYVLGFDGMDPRLASSYMEQGYLPNLRALRDRGSFVHLKTTNPAESPVAWASFAIGANPGKHGIFDFLRRDPKTYFPSLADIEKTDPEFDPQGVTVNPFAVRSLRGGKAFWVSAREHGIASVIQQVPSNWPLPELDGCYLTAGLEVPDIRWAQCSPVLFTTAQVKPEDQEHIGKRIFRLEDQGGNSFRSELPGPWNPFAKQEAARLEEEYKTLTAELSKAKGSAKRDIRITRSKVRREKSDWEKKRREPIPIPVSCRRGGELGKDELRVTVGESSKVVRLNEWSEWYEVRFPFSPAAAVSGMVKVYPLEIFPDLQVYFSPVDWDPRSPVYPISYPADWYRELAGAVGVMKTRGWAAETHGVKYQILNEDAFLQDLRELMNLRERMFFYSLEKVKVPLYVAVFSCTDRIQHMFFRYLDPRHPLYKRYSEDEIDRYARAVLDTYEKADRIVGRVMKHIGDDSNKTLIVMSDHGFASFRRGMNINTWLAESGFMVFKGQKDGSPPKPDLFTSEDFFVNTDWSRTKAYCLGLGQIYINLKGREGKGLVAREDYDRVCEEIRRGLLAYRDPVTGEQVVKNVDRREEIWSGPFVTEWPEAPDLQVNFSEGFRVSWETALGAAPEGVMKESTSKWSGDHVGVDPSVVPGVFFTNRKVAAEDPSIIDVPLTVLNLLGVPIPENMEGRVLFDQPTGKAAR